jgi:hypothetical protein
MTNEIKHTPTPWFYNYQHDSIYDAPDIRGASVCIAGIKRIPDYKANAEFIVRAVNSHNALVAALKWSRTLIYDHAIKDGFGHDIATLACNQMDEALKLAGVE